jgi:integral membrane sensor domain MASE1
MVEACLLIIGIVAVGGYIFTRTHHNGIVPSSLYAPLPLLLWAAVRFGSSGMIAALSALTGLTIAGAISGRGPFVSHAPAENLMQLQFFLIALCVPLLLLATIVQQQKQTEEALRRTEAADRTNLPVPSRRNLHLCQRRVLPLFPALC